MSTWTFTCQNHPHLRWTKNKCGGGFIGGGVLIFEGDVTTGKRGAPFGMAQRHFDKLTEEEQQHFLEEHTVECDCSMSDLRLYAKEYQPIARVYGYVAAPAGRLHKLHEDGTTHCGRHPQKAWRKMQTDVAVIEPYKCSTCYQKPRLSHLAA